MIQSISILGLGWLGIPLAKHLTDAGFDVKGSVTTDQKKEELQHLGIDVNTVKVNADSLEISDEEFFDTDLLFINIPPARIPNIEGIYPAQIKQIYTYIKKYGVDKVIFVSSTSVYPENKKTVTEIMNPKPDTASGIACLNAEQVLFDDLNFDTTVIRFGGLIGEGRNPARYMSKARNYGSGGKPVNLIHLADCIGIIEHVIIRNLWNVIINGVSPIHPKREVFYAEAARVAGLEPPVFDDSADFPFKIVTSDKLIREWGYIFNYENPMDYLVELRL